MADLEPSLDQVESGRSFQSAQAAYAAAQCSVCHAMAGTPAQGGVGPDLTSVASRFRRRDMLESIIEPSKVVSEQLADQVVVLKNSDVLVGRIIEDSETKVVVQSNPLSPIRTDVKKEDIVSRTMSKLSPMPTGLVNHLTKEEILDLIAYMEAAGRPEHPNFAKQ